MITQYTRRNEMKDCSKCNNLRHIFHNEKWIPCECQKQLQIDEFKDNNSLAESSLDISKLDLSADILVCGNPQFIRGVLYAISMRFIKEEGSEPIIVRSCDLLDISFERDAKHEGFRSFQTCEHLMFILGIGETEHAQRSNWPWAIIERRQLSGLVTIFFAPNRGEYFTTRYSGDLSNYLNTLKFFTQGG